MIYWLCSPQHAHMQECQEQLAHRPTHPMYSIPLYCRGIIYFVMPACTCKEHSHEL
jgi:hypothetical protein